MATARGIWAVKWSYVGLFVTALLQLAIVGLSGSVALQDLKGITIGATAGDIGHVATCYFDDTSFTVRRLVVDPSRWLAGRKVLISPRAFRDIDWDAKRINAALTYAQVTQSPDIDTDRSVSRQQEIEYDRYYGICPGSARDLMAAAPGPARLAPPGSPASPSHPVRIPNPGASSIPW